MPGEATVTINENQWNVWVASTYAELTTGLRGATSLPVGTGMLFILPEKQVVSVDTTGMNFPLDIVFIAESAVIDVARDIQPDYLVTEETPCDSFLEVNAGEAVDIEAGDEIVITDYTVPAAFDFNSIMPIVMLGLVFGLLGVMMTGIFRSHSSSSEVRRLGSPRTEEERARVHEEFYGTEELPSRGTGLSERGESAESRRLGEPKTEAERLETHERKYGTRELPGRGEGLKYHSITKLELRRLLERKFEDAKPRPSTKLAIEFISKEERERYGPVVDWLSWGFYIPEADAVALTFWDKPYYSDKEKEELLQTLAHELGHAIVYTGEYPKTVEEQLEAELPADVEANKLLRDWGIPVVEHHSNNLEIEEKREACMREIAEWYGEHRKEMTIRSIDPIIRRHFTTEEEVKEFVAFLESSEGREAMRKELRLEAWKRELAGPPHHSMWLTLEQRKELEKKYGSVAVRWAEEATRSGDMKGVETAAEYYYGKLKEAFGLGHLSPELSEEQIMELREVLGLPADVGEILKIHRETGYIQ